MKFTNKKISTAIIALLLTNIAFAQDAAQSAASPVESGNNQLATLLIATAIVLALVIWGMGQVLITTGRLILDKKKNTPKILSVILLAGFSLLSQISFAQVATVTDAVKVVPNYGGLSETTFYLMATVIAVEIAAILFLAFSIQRIFTELLPEKESVAKVSKLSSLWARLDKKIFTRAIPVEKEADVMLDHDYDGIRELDNALPPWWKYGFYITIVVAFIYLMNFHVFGSGKNPTEEYQAEMEKASIEKEIFESKNKDKIDESNVPMADAAGLQKAKEFFLTDCWACHGKLGEGGAGPNLTDDYWIHNGSLNDVYQSIKHGYPDKGMQSWAVKFNPKEMSLLASYIKSIHGTNPPGAKAPQGDLFAEGATTLSTDSIKTTLVDSTVVNAKK